MHNKKLGTFDLTGIPPAPRGVPQIEVTFDIDANGIVHVDAKDLGTGKEQSMTITGGSALPKEDIDRMVKDAEAHAEEDKLRREEAEVRNQAETLVYQTEKFVKDNDDKIPAEVKDKVNVRDQGGRGVAQGHRHPGHQGRDGEARAPSRRPWAPRSTRSPARRRTRARVRAGGEQASSSSGQAGAEDVVDAEIVDEDKK